MAAGQHRQRRIAIRVRRRGNVQHPQQKEASASTATPPLARDQRWPGLAPATRRAVEGVAKAEEKWRYGQRLPEPETLTDSIRQLTH